MKTGWILKEEKNNKRTCLGCGLYDFCTSILAIENEEYESSIWVDKIIGKETKLKASCNVSNNYQYTPKLILKKRRF